MAERDNQEIESYENLTDCCTKFGNQSNGEFLSTAVPSSILIQKQEPDHLKLQNPGENLDGKNFGSIPSMKRQKGFLCSVSIA